VTAASIRSRRGRGRKRAQAGARAARRTTNITLVTVQIRPGGISGAAPRPGMHGLPRAQER